ncbi:hypothetical protein SAMN05192552_1002123 [Natrinema hispanicum]|uniref:Uncharacterized protein n=2 Tax=Natrinema hispanicum TaxID=392421 RepID=A0A1G6JQX9_9EURY|nr:hypothetical protein SAMN05192552_1002123 [Natrinema hispanicum]SES68794.1 hypothetical protein SAMN04488694_101123 [Natrinema hispanicum]
MSPAYTEFLLEATIDSISASPDVVVEAILTVVKYENRFVAVDQTDCCQPVPVHPRPVLRAHRELVTAARLTRARPRADR